MPYLSAITAAVKPGHPLAAVDSFRMSKSALATKAINRVKRRSHIPASTVTTITTRTKPRPCGSPGQARQTEEAVLGGSGLWRGEELQLDVIGVAKDQD
jgi:hypothetical protein